MLFRPCDQAVWRSSGSFLAEKVPLGKRKKKPLLGRTLAATVPIWHCDHSDIRGNDDHLAVPRQAPLMSSRQSVHIRFRYLLDPLFLFCVALYSLNRRVFKTWPWGHVKFFHSYL